MYFDDNNPNVGQKTAEAVLTAVEVEIMRQNDTPENSCDYRHKFGVGPDAPAFDKFVAYGTLVWSFGWVAVFVVGSVLGATTDLLTDGFWEKFWWTKLVLITGILGTICTVWITFGGLRDALRLVRDLKNEKIDESDDGSVKG